MRARLRRARGAARRRLPILLAFVLLWGATAYAVKLVQDKRLDRQGDRITKVEKQQCVDAKSCETLSQNLRKFAPGRLTAPSTALEQRVRQLERTRRTIVRERVIRNVPVPGKSGKNGKNGRNGKNGSPGKDAPPVILTPGDLQQIADLIDLDRLVEVLLDRLVPRLIDDAKPIVEDTICEIVKMTLPTARC